MCKQINFLFLALICVMAFLQTGCSQQGDTTPPIGSEIVPESSANTLSSDEESEPPKVTWDEERVPEIQLLESKDNWNTWRIEVPVYEKNTDTCFHIQVSLPIDWEPEAVQDKNTAPGYPQYSYEFFEQADSSDKLIKFYPLSIYDYQDDEVWQSYSDKFEFLEYILPPSNGGGEGKFAYNNISLTYEEVSDVRWLLYCGFHMGYEVDPEDEGMNYCNAYSVYDDRYQPSFYLDIRDKTLDDPEAKELILSILESWEVEMRPVEPLSD